MRLLPILLIALGAAACEQPSTNTAPANAGQSSVEVDLPNRAKPFQGLVTAGQPTVEQFGELGAAGYTAVVNLRPETEAGYWDEKDAATRQMMIYKHIPIAGPEDLTRANVAKYAATFDEPHARAGKVLLHCASGNRAGAMVALNAAWTDGRTVEDAIELGRSAGLQSLEPAVRKLLEK